jgi:hypothetical protein
LILYDEKLNFLGMSEHTLSFLGYEDIADFTSMQNDVADLFVKKEGYIYKFDNFSWIDFILYSGSATKAAIIRLKNGQETNIDITIKEIFLSDSINGNKKLYSVKLISDSFHKISGVAKEPATMGGFSLNHLLNTDDTKKDTKKVIEKKTVEIQNSKSFILDEVKETTNKPKEDTQTNALDFLNTKSEEPVTLKKQESNISDNSFKIDFLSDDSKSKVDVNTRPPIEKSDSKQDIIPDDNISLNFLKTENTNSKKDDILDVKPTHDVKKDTTSAEKPQQSEKKLKLDFLKNDEPAIQKEITEQTPPPIEKKENFDSPLNFLKTNSDKSELISKEKEETPTQKLKLNFLKSEEVIKEDKDDLKSLEEVRSDDKEVKLNFLKVETPDEINITKPKDQPKAESKKPEIKLNFLKDDESKNIDNPIKENIFDKSDKKESTIKNIISLNFLKDDDTQVKTKVEKPSVDENRLNFLNIQTPTEIEKEENSEKDIEISKSQIIKQIKEDIKEIDADSEKIEVQKLSEAESKEIIFDKSDLDIQHTDNVNTNNSFVDTLKGLFNDQKETKQIQEDISTDSSDKVFSFKLKQHNEPTQEIKQLDPTDTKITVKEKEKADVNPSSYPSLKSLGLDPVQERDLISDFISDSKESINAIKYFIEIKDFDKIKYSIVKIKSSAEILSLDDIIRVTNTMKGNCESSDLAQIVNNQEILSKKIEQLEQHLSEIIV